MEVINLSEMPSLIHQYMAEMRDINVQNDKMRFRTNIERVGEILAYEISKRLKYKYIDITTPLGVAHQPVIDEQIVLGTILRAGLPLHLGFQRFYDDAENAFVSAYRKYKDRLNFDIHIEYMAAPRIDGKTLILVDPMLATGSSMELAYEALLSKGMPKKVHVASVIASKQGIEYIKNTLKHEDITLWVGAVDDDINEHSYIVPGLGDAGDLAYGIKE